MRRRLLLVVLIALIALVVVWAAVRPAHIFGYRVLDDYNIAVQVIGVNPLWRAVTQHTESASEVTIGISEFNLPQFGAGFGDERIAYVAIRLNEPLAGRQVIDAASGAVIPQVRTANQPST